MATACESKTSGYAVMRWIDDGSRLSVHNLKQVIEPRIPVNAFKPSDNGTAKFRGYPGIWKFKILAVGGKFMYLYLYSHILFNLLILTLKYGLSRISAFFPDTNKQF